MVLAVRVRPLLPGESPGAPKHGIGTDDRGVLVDGVHYRADIVLSAQDSLDAARVCDNLAPPLAEALERHARAALSYVELGGVPEPGAVDLLGPPSRPTTSVYAGESQSAGAVIAGASEVDVSDASEAEEWIQYGQTVR